jgi:peptide/nickel transport system ATP-binding protein/oligopeptide transport system ATP-binding protein
MSDVPLLEVRDVRVHFPVRSGLWGRARDVVKAVDGVSFSVARGKTVGLVGESGSGKTTLGRAILQLVPVTSGSVHLDGQRIDHLAPADFRPLRKRCQMIFQDPFNSLNPRRTVRQTLAEPLEIHFPKLTRNERYARCADLMRMVGLQPEQLDRYPHEFSGGQRQRIGIARALAVEPDFIVCDEPVSALDVSVQAQIVNLLQDLQEQLKLTYLFIAHDLAVVEHISDHVLVMFRGSIVESASAEQLYAAPAHEYTRKLLDAVPTLERAA